MFARLDDREVALLVVAVVVATAVFVLLALAYEGAAVSGVDDDVARWVGDELPTWVEWPSRVFSWVGGWIGLVVGGMVMGVVLLWERAWIDLGFLIAAFAGSQLVASGLKSVSTGRGLTWAAPYHCPSPTPFRPATRLRAQPVSVRSPCW